MRAVSGHSQSGSRPSGGQELGTARRGFCQKGWLPSVAPFLGMAAQSPGGADREGLDQAPELLSELGADQQGVFSQAKIVLRA